MLLLARTCQNLYVSVLASSSWLCDLPHLQIYYLSIPGVDLLEYTSDSLRAR
jgi:hypothetical protein